MILSYDGKSPQLGENNLVAPGAVIAGDVTTGKDCSFWFNAVVRGDVHYVLIGTGTNIQDSCVLHETYQKYPLIIGNEVTIGHGAVVHACTIEDHCLIGINSTILDNAIIGKGAIIAANAVVRPHTKVPDRTLMAGVPAKPVRDVTDEEYQHIIDSARRYIMYSRNYLQGPQGRFFMPANLDA